VRYINREARKHYAKSLIACAILIKTKQAYVSVSLTNQKNDIIFREQSLLPKQNASYNETGNINSMMEHTC
jgi:beta-lactamase regulating signal transducer with metallopeptidase domain